MKMIVILISICFALYTLFFHIRTEIFLKKASKEIRCIKSVNKKNKQIIIAIPVLREQNCIEDTVKYFNSKFNDIPVVLVSTQKEIKENEKNEKTTQEIIKKKIIGKYNNVYWINYPYENGYMADQLNYMLDNIELIFDKKINLEKTYLALYNADSRPNDKTFEEITQKIENNDVVQQYSYCMQNYEKLGRIPKGFSIYQSNFELKTGLINSFYRSNVLYTHVVGHGLIINMKLLKYLGNLNTEFWCEDVYLGIQLKFNNIKITPLLTLENMETPDKLSKIVKQNSVWFKTTSQFWKIYKDIIKKGKAKNRIKGMVGIFNEFRCAINWLGFPIILLITFIISIIANDYLSLLIFITSYISYIIVNTICTIKLINKLDNKEYRVTVNLLLDVFIATTISNLGPLYSIIPNKKEKYKTER